MFAAALPSSRHVKVDETLLNRVKPAAHPFLRRRRRREQRWLWGATTQEGVSGGDTAFVLLTSTDEPRGAENLRAALLATVAPGSEVVCNAIGKTLLRTLREGLETLHYG